MVSACNSVDETAMAEVIAAPGFAERGAEIEEPVMPAACGHVEEAVGRQSDQYSPFMFSTAFRRPQ